MTKAVKKASPVKIVDSKLILSLPDAKDPVVWQMSLEQAQASAFTVKEDKKAKLYNLVFKMQGEEEEIIAPFTQRQDAVDVLMHASEALQSAQGKITGKAGVAAVGQKSEKGDKMGAVLAVILIILLFFTWTIFSSAPSRLAGMDRIEDGNYRSETRTPRDSTGVPVSADDFLSNR